MKTMKLPYKTMLAVLCLFSIVGALFADILICRHDGSQFFYIPLLSSHALETVSVSKTILYLFLQRLKQLLILTLLFQVINPRLLIRVLVFGFSFLFGILCSCQFYQLRFTGVFWFLLCLFPHYILYGFATVTLYKLTVFGKQEKEQYIYYILLLAFLVTGVLSEGIISRFFLKNFLQYIGM